MTYRVSLHLLAALWNLLLFFFSVSRWNKQPYYKPLGWFCFFSALYALSWALGIHFESLFWMRMTWIGILMPIAIFSLLNPLFDNPQPKSLHRTIWIAGWGMALLGMTPWVIVSMDQYHPSIQAQVGWAEPPLRVALLILILGTIIAYLRYWFSSTRDVQYRTKFVLLGCVIYGGGAGLTCSITPLMGYHQFLEWTSFGSVIWTTFSTWHVLSELQRKEEDLSELDQMKRSLISQITHEFRTPINAIESAVDMLSDNKTDSTSYINMIKKNSERLREFVDDLLDLAALQQSKVTLNKTSFDLNKAIQETVVLQQTTALHHQTEISVEGPDIEIHADKKRIQQILTNLLSNAIKADSKNIQVKTSHSPNNNEVEVRISDDGKGISSDELKLIFDSFYQAKAPSSPAKGSGLGLAIAKGWVETHGGKIWAESEGLGKGTTIGFTLSFR